MHHICVTIYLLFVCLMMYLATDDIPGVINAQKFLPLNRDATRIKLIHLFLLLFTTNVCTYAHGHWLRE